MKFCPECGFKNEGFKFCPNCGYNFKESYLSNKTNSNIETDASTNDMISSEVWQKLILKKEDIDVVFEMGLRGDPWDDEDDYSAVSPIIELQKKLILTFEDIDTLKLKTNSDFGYMNLSEEEDVFYFGQIKEGLKHGFGAVIATCIEAQSEVIDKMLGTNARITNSISYYIIHFSGNWINDLKEGFGIEISKYDLEPRFIGNWKSDKKNGFGTEFYSKKERYTGEWKDDAYYGLGIKYYKNGSKEYEGEWDNGKNGKGIHYYFDPSNQKRLEGIFTENSYQVTGKGIEYYPSGDIKFEGEWKDDEYIIGKRFYEDGIAEGEWKDDELNGIGKITLNNGNIFEGYFVDGKLNGKGKLIESDGATYDGDWVEGERHGLGKLSSTDGTIFEGEWQNDSIIGFGKSIDSDGIIYEGYWHHGKRHGSGKIKQPDGYVFDGYFVNNKKNGKGKITKPDGIIIEGFWEENNLLTGSTSFEKKEQTQSSPIPPKDSAGIR